MKTKLADWAKYAAKTLAAAIVPAVILLINELLDLVTAELAAGSGWVAGIAAVYAVRNSGVKP